MGRWYGSPSDHLEGCPEGAVGCEEGWREGWPVGWEVG